MLERIVQGETDAEVLVKEARGALRKKEAERKGALAEEAGTGLPAPAEAVHTWIKYACYSAKWRRSIKRWRAR